MKAQPLDVRGVLGEFLARGQRAQRVVDHLAAYGPGLTFGELAIGELFAHASPLDRPDVQQPSPHVKLDATRYGCYLAAGVPTGTGSAEDYYRVERWPAERLTVRAERATVAQPTTAKETTLEDVAQQLAGLIDAVGVLNDRILGVVATAQPAPFGELEGERAPLVKVRPLEEQLRRVVVDVASLRLAVDALREGGPVDLLRDRVARLEEQLQLDAVDIASREAIDKRVDVVAHYVDSVRDRVAALELAVQSHAVGAYAKGLRDAEAAAPARAITLEASEHPIGEELEGIAALVVSVRNKGAAVEMKGDPELVAAVERLAMREVPAPSKVDRSKGTGSAPVARRGRRGRKGTR